MRKLERIIEFLPAFDRRDPDPMKNYGIHGVEMRWYLKGSRGAVQFVVYTGWQLQHVFEENVTKLVSTPDPVLAKIFIRPMGADVGYHSAVPTYADHKAMQTCHLLEQGYCYYDGSGLAAEDMLNLLIEKGHEAVWQAMEERYREWLFPDCDLIEEGPFRLPTEDGGEWT